jgi:hypothetical protein
MSKLFFDHLVSLTHLEVVIKTSAQSKEEQEELWHLVDDIVQHKVMHTILDHLPNEHHNEFLEEFTKAPHDEAHVHYLKDKSGKDIEDIILREMRALDEELVKELNVTSLKKK